MRTVGGVLISHPWTVSQYVDKPLKSVTHSQCVARLTVTFPATGHHRPLTGIELYCLVTEAHVFEKLAQGCYIKAQSRESNQRPLSRKCRLREKTSSHRRKANSAEIN